MMDEGADLFGVSPDLPARQFAGRLALLLFADGAGFETRETARIAVGLDGLAGDRHAGTARPACSRVPWYPRGTPIRNSRQVSIVAPDEIAEIARRLNLAELRPGWIGANLVIEGVPQLTRLPPGTRLHFPSSAALVVEAENQPCRHAGAAVAAATGAPVELEFAKAARGLRGLVGWVERAGELCAGDAIKVKVPAQRLWRG